MNKEGIERVQQLLYVWISNFDKKSLENIKQNCDYLNEIYHLELQNPIWGIFWPLVFNGVIDHLGNGYYTLSEPIVLDYGTHFYYINVFPKEVKSKHVSAGITFSETYEEVKCKTMCPSAIAILKSYPCIKDVVDKFDVGNEDESNLKYVNWKSKRGLAELEKEGLTRYFSLPEKLYLRQLPSRAINPEAYALSYCLTRVVNNELNGRYNGSTHQLTMPTFAMPFMVYRVLLLECMASKQLPRKQVNNYIFENISTGTVKQLNRIFCNTIQYE
ncbi:MAG: hypothetical protein LUD00_05525 [Prevotellaceae bacterium]|nr:hypothetical protein [Prevotellaceae bacterium]